MTMSTIGFSGHKRLAEAAALRNHSRIGKPCRWCGNPIKVRVSEASDLFPAGVPLGSNFLRMNDPEHYFCTLRCGFLFGASEARRYPR